MDCGPTNPLNSLKQQFDTETFQDSFRGSSSGLRQQQIPQDVHRQQLAEEFLRASAGATQVGNLRGPETMFAFRDLHQELDSLQPGSSNQVVRAATAADWQAEFAHFKGSAGLAQSELLKFDAAFHAAKQSVLQPPGAWTSDFQAFAAQRHSHLTLSAEDNAVLERAFQEAQAHLPLKAWGEEFADQEHAKAQEWIQEFQGETGNSDLAKTAGELLEAVDTSDPKFANSEFVKFMAQLRDENLGIEGDKVVEKTAPASAWASEFQERVDGYVDSTWNRDFEQKQHQGVESAWAEDFSMPELETELDSTNWLKEWEEAAGKVEAAQLQAWDADVPAYGEYQFEPSNQFLFEPLDHLLAMPLDTLSLSESILVLEALVKHNPQDAQSWMRLGAKQQENEREQQAIIALRTSVKLDPILLDAWLALGVSFTNENRPEPAFDALRQWIRHHPRYRDLAEHTEPTKDSFRDVSNLFLQAATREQALDADVQVGLGVLFNVSEEYEKAVDCFREALNERPKDYQLWNKLGATLANSHDSSRAMDAYFHALAINPSYIRARYNLAIACINLGQHREAGHHLLEALSIQRSSGNVTLGFMSSNVWETLKMAVLLMNKSEWARMCDDRNYDALKAAFDEDL